MFVRITNSEPVASVTHYELSVVVSVLDKSYEVIMTKTVCEYSHTNPEVTYMIDHIDPEIEYLKEAILREVERLES